MLWCWLLWLLLVVVKQSTSIVSYCGLRTAAVVAENGVLSFSRGCAPIAKTPGLEASSCRWAGVLPFENRGLRVNASATAIAENETALMQLQCNCIETAFQNYAAATMQFG